MSNERKTKKDVGNRIKGWEKIGVKPKPFNLRSK